MERSLFLPLLFGVGGLGLGLVLGVWFLAGTGGSSDAVHDSPRRESTVESARLADLEQSSEEWLVEIARLKTDNARLSDRVDELVLELETTPPAETAPVESPPRQGLALAYGDYGELEALLGADWARVAEGLELIGADLVALAKTFDEGGEVDPELSLSIAKENQKLRDFALQVIGKLPTNVSGNGEFCHPVAQANLLAGLLDRGDNPLTDYQKDAIAGFGEDYDAEWNRMSESYSEGTSRLQKLLDEAELKQDFVHRTQEALTADQLSRAYPEATEGRVGLDILSPGVMLNHNGRSVAVASPEQLRPALMKRVSNLLGVSAEALGSQGAIFDDWIADVEDLMEEPVRVRRLGSYRVEEGLVAGRAQIRALEALAAALELDDRARARLLQNPAFFVPRLKLAE